MIPRGLYGAARVRGGLSTLALTHIAASGADLTTYTFTSVAIGAATDSRRVIIGAAARAATNRTLSSVTVNGSAASVVYAPTTTNGTSTGWAVAHVPSGTTATIAATWGGAMVRGGIAVWTIGGSITASGAGVATNGFTAVIPDGDGLLCVGLGPASTFTNPTPSSSAATGESFDIAAADRIAPGSLSVLNSHTPTFAQVSGIYISP